MKFSANKQFNFSKYGKYVIFYLCLLLFFGDSPVSVNSQSLPLELAQRSSSQNAIAEFEKSLITPKSRFDRYLRGEEEVFCDRKKKGIKNLNPMVVLVAIKDYLLGTIYFNLLALRNAFVIIELSAHF